MGSELVSTLGALMYPRSGTLVGLQLIVEILTGSKDRYYNFVGLFLQVTLLVPPAGSSAKFLPHPFDIYRNYPFPWYHRIMVIYPYHFFVVITPLLSWIILLMICICILTGSPV